MYEPVFDAIIVDTQDLTSFNSENVIYLLNTVSQVIYGVFTSNLSTSENSRNRIFIQEYDFKRHMSIHRQEQLNYELYPYKCSICNKSFSQNSILRGHVKKIHTRMENSESINLKAFACNICHKEYLYKDDLTRHMLNHPEEAYVEIREKAFKYKNNLNRKVSSAKLQEMRGNSSSQYTTNNIGEKKT